MDLVVYTTYNSGETVTINSLEFTTETSIEIFNINDLANCINRNCRRYYAHG